jgi:hypothetical protein
MADEEVGAAVAEDLVAGYLAAWTERRSAARRRLLEQCWQDGATLSAWTTHVQGLDALDAHIASVQRQHPRQCRRVRTCDPHISGNKVSFTWALVDDDGTVLVEGSEWAEVGSSGRFARVTSFAGRAEPADKPIG